MKRPICGLLLLGLFVFLANSNVHAQAPTDAVTVRDHKDGSNKTHNGTLKVSTAGFQVVGTDNKVLATISPDDIVKFSVGELPNVDRDAILAANVNEDKKEYEAALTAYNELLKKVGKEERSKRYLTFKKLQLMSKMADDLDTDKGWKEKVEACVKEWSLLLTVDDVGLKTGWEQWFSVRIATRLQIELGKFEDAARTWTHISKNANMPPDARLEASLQEIDLQIRGEKYSVAGAGAAELLKTASGAKKDRLTIYSLAAKAAGDNKPLEGIDKIKAVMDKTKDPSVHATGFSMMGELYLMGKKPRDAMWMFLWVETVTNQDKDEVLKALVRLVGVFEAQMDDDQVKKYQEKIKRFRGNL